METNYNPANVPAFDRAAITAEMARLSLFDGITPSELRRVLATGMPMEPMDTILRDSFGITRSELQARGVSAQTIGLIGHLITFQKGVDQMRDCSLGESPGEIPLPDLPAPQTPAPQAPAPVTIPEPLPAPDKTAAAVEILRDLLGGNKQEALSAQEREDLKVSIRSEILAEFGSSGGKPTRIEIIRPDAPDKPEDAGLQHAAFPLLMAAIRSGVNLALVGPAGSAKTTAAMNAARVLGREFTTISCSPTMTTGQVIGRPTVDGGWVDGPMVQAMRGGHVFLKDEFDKMRADLAPMVNSATANRYIGLPTGELLEADPNTVFIAAMNTFGTGATDLYASQKQDAATMDRYFFIEWLYDPQLEAAMCGLNIRIKGPDYSIDKGGLLGTGEAWFRYILKVRETLEKEHIKHVVSPRATQMGIRLAKEGIGIHWLINGLVTKGLKPAQIEKIEAATASHRDALTA